MAEESSGAAYMPVPVIVEPNDDDNDNEAEVRRHVTSGQRSAYPNTPEQSDPSDSNVDETTPLQQGSYDGVRLLKRGRDHRENVDENTKVSGQQGLDEPGQTQQQHPTDQQADQQNEQQDQQQNDGELDEELLFPGFVPKTFYMFTQRNYIRFWCLRCITWPWFERISMFVIILNCVTLGMYQPCNDEECVTMRCRVLQAFDHFIFAFFAIEMIIKMIAMGVIGKETYLADSWNRLDCFIVVAGTIEYAVDREDLSLSAIRTIRVLRPLRAINRIPSMRILVMLLLDTLPMLGNVLLLCFFVFFIFGIIGVQLWSGVLRHRCYLDLNESIGRPSYVSEYYTPKNKLEYICSPMNESGMGKCVNFPPYEYEGIKCSASAEMYSNNTPTNESCVNWNQYYTNCLPHSSNPYQGSVSFDNIGYAWVAIFQVISLESWVNIMYYVQDAHSFWDWIYFVALIVIGSFFMINLCLVVIATQFSETKKRETERMMQERKRFQSCSTLASNSEPGGCYSELLKLVAQVYRRVKRKVIKTYYKTRGLQKINPEKSLSLRRKKSKKKGLFADNLLMDIVGDKQLTTQLSMQSDTDVLQPGTGQTQADLEAGSGGGSGVIGSGDKELAGEHDTLSYNPTAVIIAGGDTLDSDLETSKDESGVSMRSSNICEMLNCLQKKLKTFVESNYFQRSILIAILLNTLSMGVEYHQQPQLLTTILEYSNIVFCVLFGAEMALKISAYGLFGYISNGFNVFDGFIVILSICELASDDGDSGLSVLRTFRLLRILKLVRFMPALRRQLVVMLRTMDNVATFFALLVLFMFIFSILGMNLFGCKFCRPLADGKRKCDRKNFDSLLWAIITVFQVLTQEDWNTVLYNGMDKTSPWASLYFVALMTFGNYVLFNLLVAILVEGFSTEDEEKKKEKMKELEEVDKEDEEDEEEKEKQRLAENNNIDESQSARSCLNSGDLDVKNNKEKEKKMLALPPISGTSIKTDSPPQIQGAPPTDGPLNPPIITHTAATPMATPQGSPNENAIKDTNNKLSVSVKRSALKSSLSVDSDKSPNFRGSSPRPSPCLRRTNSRGSHHQRTASWRARNRRLRGDKTNLVVDSMSDSADDVDDDVFSSSHSQSPTYSAGMPRTPSVNTHGHAVTYVFSDCNGHPPLNNQRALSPQNSMKGRALTPRNSFKSHHTWSRNNSVGSGRSICNSFELSRQNSFTSHRTLNSLGSGNSKDDNKSNKNYVDLPDVKIALDKEEGREQEIDEPDPDAIDETEWNCSWCPQPKGCFLERHEYAFYLLSNENRIRKFALHLISRKWFDNSVLFFIALNCITLAMERPDIPPDSMERYFLTYTNYIFTFVFALEMMIKVIAKGFFIGKHAYLKSGWNIMDGFLVIISLIDILISMSASSSPRIFGILRVFRLLRTLRPLRVISRAPGLKLVVQTLLSSLRPIGNIVLICCTFFIIFGILGVQLFKGMFYYCKGANTLHVTNRSECESRPGNTWVNRKYNFDNLGQALMALFVLASKDGWVQIMYTGLDAVGIDKEPIENNNEWRLIYFISFLLLVAFFVLNMFVGVVVENFHKCRESQEIEERAKRAAKRQEKLDKKRKKMREPPYWAHYSHSRLLIHTVINSKYFDLAIAAVIGLNVITMAMEYYKMPEELDFALKIFNFFFTSVFILEAVMKIIALGFYRYIRDRWNQLDIMIVILSIVGIVLEEMRTNVIPINPTIIRVMRVLRIARVLKLLKMAKGIRALLDTVIQALPQVGNLGLLFFLLFFIFAALGVELFGRLDCIEHVCEGLGSHAHFQNFGMAFLTLFRVATGDNWNGIMKDTLREDCDKNDNCLKNCCVSAFIAPVYFVVFVLMAQFVLVNVVVAVLMKHLEETYKYKELDDELEDELRAEMCALALAGKAGPDGIEIKESHRMMDDDSILIRDALITITKANDDLESKESGVEDDNPGGLQVSNLPSFTFSVRPPSEEQSRSEDAAGTSPVNASLTIENMGSSWSSMDSNRLAITPSMTGSSNSSERSVRISSPPIRRAHSPYLLNLQGSSGSSGSIHRRPLVKQYSMDVGSDPQLNNINTSMPDVWDKFKGAHKAICNTDNSISRSQPSLKDLKSGSLEGKTDCSMDSKDSTLPGERLPARDRIKHKLLRSRSSGAKYSRFRDKYKQSNLNKAVHLNNSESNVSKERIKRSNQTGSTETGSDIDESLCSDWGSEEAACDLEVKMITGGTEDEEDDIHPTLSPYISEDRDIGHLAACRTAVDSAACRTAVDSAGSSQLSTPRGESTPRAMKPSYPKCKSPMPPVLQSSRNAPGIDNTSFELGEDVRLPPCCKARETAAVRRSNSFSSSKLMPKAFSPPRTISPRSDRSLSPYTFREHTTSVSPLALPPSPLALEDSAYKLRCTDGGMREMAVSPLPFSHSHMLTVPSPHSLYSNPHMRSPSPTPPKHVHLAPPSSDCPFSSRRQVKGSPAPIRRQQTLSRSSAVDQDTSPPAVTSPLRHRIPHTLSMDSAFLIPPGISQSYSINEPYMELHAGCRASSPLPSPRNSQQTLPGMFTRSASPQPHMIQSPPHKYQQPPELGHQNQSPSSDTIPSVSATVSIAPTSPETASTYLSIPVPAPNAKDVTALTGEELVPLACSSPIQDSDGMEPISLTDDVTDQHSRTQAHPPADPDDKL